MLCPQKNNQIVTANGLGRAPQASPVSPLIGMQQEGGVENPVIDDATSKSPPPLRERIEMEAMSFGEVSEINLL